MTADSFKDAVVTFLRDHQSLAEPIVFALGFAEGIPLLSWFVPSSALFLAIGSLYGGAGGDIYQLWAAAAAGAVVGDCVTYTLGRFLKDDAQHVWPLSRHAGWLPRGHALFERWGVLVVIGGKFLGFMRPFIPVVAGIVEMPVALFLIASVVSSVAWAGAFLVPSWGIGRLFD
jgi:membrane protein DedA with SNARE-associated domain